MRMRKSKLSQRLQALFLVSLGKTEQSVTYFCVAVTNWLQVAVGQSWWDGHY